MFFLLVIIHRNLQKVNNLRVILRDLREMVFLTVKNKQAGLLSHVYLNFPFFLFSLQQFCNNKISTIYIFTVVRYIYLVQTLFFLYFIVSYNHNFLLLASMHPFYKLFISPSFFATTNISSLLFFCTGTKFPYIFMESINSSILWHL